MEPSYETNRDFDSCHWFRSNEVRLWMSVLAYNLGNLWGRLGCLPCDAPEPVAAGLR